MASMKTFISIAAIAALVQLAVARDYKVGQPNGSWDTATDLKTWAAGRKFAPGDSLTFTYAPSHDVVEVTKAGYDACSASSPLGSYTGGSTTIKLASPGKRYFICGVPGHCAAGMKLEVDVRSTTAVAPPLATPNHQRSQAPAMAPAFAPVKAPAMATPLDLPSVLSPAPVHAPMPSGAVGIGKSAKVGMGIGMGLFLVLAL